MKTLGLISLLLMLASCGGSKSGGSSGKKESPYQPGDCCDSRTIEIGLTAQQLDVFWKKLEDLKSANWSKSSSLFSRSVFFGQQYEKQVIKIEIRGVELNEKELAMVFLEFNRGLEQASGPDTSKLATKLFNEKE